MHRRRRRGAFLLLPSRAPLVDDDGGDVPDDCDQCRNERHGRHRDAREVGEREVRRGGGDAVREDDVGERGGSVVREEIGVAARRAVAPREGRGRGGQGATKE